jgi:hypothetical protein
MRTCDLAWSLWAICCVCSVWSCWGSILMSGKFCWNIVLFHHGYVTCLYVVFYLVGDACTEYVAILLVYVSILAYCSALCLFEKHMLAFVALIHALPTRGTHVNQFISRARKYPFCIHGEFLQQRREMHLFRGSLHSCRGSSLCCLNFSCALLPMVSSPFASPWGVNIFWSRLCWDVALALGDRDFSLSSDLWLLFGFWSLVWVFCSFLFFFCFHKLVTMCVVNALVKG